jgi:hypothetical protein
MGQLILDLLPLVIGVMLSPLAIMALVAILVSDRARVNGSFYLVGWVLGLSIVLAVSCWILLAIDIHALPDAPLWIAWVRIIIGVFVGAAAVWVYRKGHAHVAAMARATTPQDVVAAAPQLPGWLQSVATFTPLRSLALGLGLFVLNPVDASCAILAGVDLVLGTATPAQTALAAMVFAVLGILPIAVPVIGVLFLGERVRPQLDALRTWVASHTNVMNAAMLLVIAVLQLQKGISALL